MPICDKNLSFKECEIELLRHAVDDAEKSGHRFTKSTHPRPCRDLRACWDRILETS